METCRSIDGLVTAYVDGEGTPAERAAVGAHLAACPPCRQLAAVEDAARRVVRAHADTLRGEAPAALRARCFALRSAQPERMTISSLWRRPMVSLFATAALVLALGGLLVYSLTAGSSTMLATQLAIDHMKCFALFPGAGPVDVRAAEAGLQQRYGWQIRLPEGAGTSGVQLVGARRCFYGRGSLAHLMYRVDGRPVSLFMLPGTVRPSAVVSALGHEAVIWSAEGATFVLLGREPRVELQRIAVYLSGRTE